MQQQPSEEVLFPPNSLSYHGGYAAEHSLSQQQQHQIVPIETWKLFVGQLPFSFDEEQVAQLFKPIGDVYEVVILRDRDNGLHKGCAFVTFLSREVAQRAIDVLHGKKTLPPSAKPLQIKFADVEQEKLKKQFIYGSATHHPENKIFVGMIPRDCTEDDLREVFCPFGNVVEVILLRKKGESKGCGFIRYEHLDDAIDAINNLNGKFYMKDSSTTLVVRFADSDREKTKREQFRTIRQVLYGPTSSAAEHSYKSSPSLYPQQPFSPPLNSFPSTTAMHPSPNRSSNLLHNTTTINSIPPLNIASDNPYATTSPPKQNPYVLSNASSTCLLNSTPLLPSLPTNSHPHYSTTGYILHPTHAPLPPSTNYLPPSSVAPLSTDTTPIYSSSFYASTTTTHSHPQQHTSLYYQPYTPISTTSTTTAATASSSGRSRSLSGVKGPEGANIFVYNLPNFWNDEDLFQVFQSFGTILSTKVFYDKQTNRSRCFGIISFQNPQHAKQAVDVMNGYNVQGRRLQVSIKKNDHHS